MMGVAGAELQWRLVDARLGPPYGCRCDGDPNCDGVVEIRDVMATVDVAFRGGRPEIDPGCSWYAHSAHGRTDVDCSDGTDVMDVILMIDAVVGGMESDATPCGSQER